VRVAELKQLFDPMDPSPVYERDLDRRTEAFIIGWATEAPRNAPLAMRVHLASAGGILDDVMPLRDAIHRYFQRRATATRRRLRDLFRQGRISLLIGILTLGTMLAFAGYLDELSNGWSFGNLLRESLIIGGWVAMWRPLEVFLYDWWPIRAQARLYDRLAVMPVDIVYEADKSLTACTKSPAAPPGEEQKGSVARPGGYMGKVDRNAESVEKSLFAGEQSHYLRLTWLLQLLLVIGLILFLVRRDWENVFLTATVILLTLIPAFLFRRYRVILPPEFQLIAALFVFLSLFLGSAFDFYYRFWWWDMALHGASGFLLGIIGFIALYVLNQTAQLPPQLKPAFRCFFGFTFAVTLGVVWEIFEFAMDRFWPALDMQSTGTGVVDTMKDLIVDAIGAAVVALMGYAYLKTGRYSFLGDAVRGFLRRNPRLLGHRRK
jgi:hypothetical protein